MFRPFAADGGRQTFPIAHLKRNAIFALVALLGLFGLYHLAIQPSLSQLVTGVPFINAYGRQRMLSQRLTKGVLACQYVAAPEARAQYAGEIRTTLEEWSAQHTHLIRQDFGYLRNRQIESSLQDLDQHFRTIRTATDRFLAGIGLPNSECRTLTESILIEEPLFLARMDEIVRMYETEVNRRVGELRMGGWVIFALLTATACFLYFRVISPVIQALSTVYSGNLARYRTLVENMTDGIALVNRLGTIQFANNRLQQMLQRDQDLLLDTRLDDLLVHGPGARTSLLSAIVEQGTVESRFSCGEEHGIVETIVRSRRVDATTEVEQDVFLLVFTDVTHEKAEKRRMRELQDQLTHVNRLKTVGEMSASLTHELGQPLGAISAFVGGCKYQLNAGQLSPQQMQEHLQRIDLAASRAAEILKRFRSYGRRAEFSTALIDFPSLLVEVRELCTPMLAEGQADLVIECEASLPLVHGDGLLLQQVLINLIQNAIQSLGDLPPFRRTIQVQITAENSSSLQISVIDRGRGISTEVLPRLQEPFFTTRSTGLGLGLAICRTIIEDHEGHLCLSSEVGLGTTVRINLPAVVDEVRHA